jgi:hypothetical protein
MRGSRAPGCVRGDTPFLCIKGCVKVTVEVGTVNVLFQCSILSCSTDVTSTRLSKINENELCGQGTSFNRPQIWRQRVPPKRRLTFNGLYGVIFQESPL